MFGALTPDAPNSLSRSIPMSSITDLAEMIVAPQRVYQAAFDADLRLLRAQHCATAIAAALKLVERNARRDGDGWDQAGHAEAVRYGIARLIGKRAFGKRWTKFY